MMNHFRRILAVLMAAGSTFAGAAADTAGERDGAALYQQYCASCHEGGVAKAPQFSLLEIMPHVCSFACFQGLPLTAPVTTTSYAARQGQTAWS